jgi:hypothetical protein
VGLRFQEAILKELSSRLGKKYRLAKPEEESKGIDGFIDNIPVSVKPETYKLERDLKEKIKAPIIYYRKEKDCIIFDVSEVIRIFVSHNQNTNS